MRNMQHVIDHIHASYPCSLQSIVNWCIEQGFEEDCCPVITSMLMDHQIELDIQDGKVIVSPL